MWVFTRGIRLELPLASEDEAIAILEAALQTWDESAQEPWQHWFPASSDPKTEFRETWRKLKTDRLELALRRADALPLKPRLHGTVRNYVRCLSLAFHLQIERGAEPIFLSCHALGRLLSADPKTIWNYRSFACELGLLMRTARSTSRTQADEFKFAVELFDRASGEQSSCGTQSCVAVATHEIHELVPNSNNSFLTHESHEIHENQRQLQRESETSCVASNPAQGAILPLKKKPAPEPYIPTAAETAVILQNHRQWYYGRPK